VAAPSPSPRPLRSPPEQRLDSSGGGRESGLISRTCSSRSWGRPAWRGPAQPLGGRHQGGPGAGTWLQPRARSGWFPQEPAPQPGDRTVRAASRPQGAPGGEPPPTRRGPTKQKAVARAAPGQGALQEADGLACRSPPFFSKKCRRTGSANSSAIDAPAPNGLADRPATAGAAGLASMRRSRAFGGKGGDPLLKRPRKPPPGLRSIGPGGGHAVCSESSGAGFQPEGEIGVEPAGGIAPARRSAPG